MNQPALVLGTAFEPLFLTAAGARLLQIKNREQLSLHAQLLEPFIQLGRKTSQPKLVPGGPSQEMTVSSSDGLPIPVFAAAVEAAREKQAIVVLFWDLRPYQPWFALVQQSQKTRPALVYASAMLGGVLTEKTLEDASISGLPANQKTDTDLLLALTGAVEIADSLVSPSFKITLDVSTSALLASAPPDVIRLFAHLFLEAFDYAGPLGRARVGAILGRETIQLLILASRSDSAASGFGPLELFLSKRAILTDYRVRSAELPDRIRPEERAFVERHLGGVLSMEFDLVRTLPEELHSENLRIARHAADRAGAAIEVKVDPPRHLLLSAHLPLALGAQPKTLQNTPPLR